MALGETPAKLPESCEPGQLDTEPNSLPEEVQDTEDDSTNQASPYRAYVRTSAPYIPGQGITRYMPALQNLIPVRKKHSQRQMISVDSAGLFSFVTFTWVSKYLYKAFKDGLSFEDLPHGSPLDSCDYNSQRLELLWQQEMVRNGPRKAKLGVAVWKFLRTRLLAASFTFLLSISFGFIGPTIFMRKILEYSDNIDADIWDGIFWAICLSFSEFLRTIFLAWCWAINIRTAIRLRSACLALLYRKVIRLNKLGDHSVGQLINLFAVDSQRLFDMVIFGPMIIGGPLVTLAGLVYIYWLLGAWALLGMTTFLVFYPIQYGITRLSGYLHGKAVKVGDQRVRLVSEILSCIKIIKMYAWEDSFDESLQEIRREERQLLQKTAYCQSVSLSMAPTVPIISAIVTFLVHIAAGNNLTAPQAFSVWSLLTKQLPQLLVFVKKGCQHVWTGLIAIRRFQAVLLLEDPTPYISRPIDKSVALAIGSATFAWASDNACSDVAGKDAEKQLLNGYDRARLNVLFDINVEVAKGSLVGICGVVGSGKTSLLLAALGQLRMLRGHVTRDGTCAYVSQEAWILNATLRDNILFGENFNAKRYYDTIYACCLTEDVNMLPGGDSTEIGERGINLSGGQKQRVSLARAVYSNRDIYLLDDPLSAVDSQVSAHIFEKCILTTLKCKTVLFVTHEVQLLNCCDMVLVMKDGHVAEQGTHQQLMSSDLDYALMVNNRCVDITAHSVSNTSTTCPQNVGDSTMPPLGAVSVDGDKLIQKEEVGTGSISLSTYTSYVTSAGGMWVAFFVIICFLINVGSTAFSSWWLAIWLDDGSGGTSVVVNATNNATVISSNINDNPKLAMYQTVYAATIGIILVTSFIRGYVLTKVALRASSKLHDSLFRRILHAPMSFFDTTPTGRIQNLFSRDMDEVDSRLPFSVESILQNIFMVFFAVLFICLVFPWFMIPFTLLAFLYYFISKVFRTAVRDLKRLESVSRSPIFSFVGTTVQGLSTIHAFCKETEFIAKFTQMFDENSTCNYMCHIATRWLAVRLDVLAVSITAITAIMIIALHGKVSVALAGLALAYSAHITGMFQYTVRLISEIEVRFISVERIQSYLQNVDREGESGKETIPPPDWPNGGSLKFENVSLSYRSGLPNVLNNVSFRVVAGEKVGIVGRTGSGKSSLVLALFRLVELSAGKIKIDGINIGDVSLTHLRRRLSVIPQDPVLFEGTVRSNLDPFGEHSDDKLWTALEKTRLKQRVKNMDSQLESTVSNSSDYLSLGERQLLCLARALLRETKVLLLDEATAAVDPETEAAVQSTIALEFSHATVLTIAHRLATVTNSDRVLVLSHGQILEYDTPDNLLANTASEFSRMLNAAKVQQE